MDNFYSFVEEHQRLALAGSIHHTSQLHQTANMTFDNIHVDILRLIVKEVSFFRFLILYFRLKNKSIPYIVEMDPVHTCGSLVCSQCVVNMSDFDFMLSQPTSMPMEQK